MSTVAKPIPAHLAGLSAINASPKEVPGHFLVEQAKMYWVMWWVGTIAMYGVMANEPRLHQTIGDRGEAELGYQFTGAIFWFAVTFFIFAYLGASTLEKKAVALTMALITSLPAMTYTFVIPYRLGLTFQDLNGNPLDMAPHWEAFMATPLLCHVIGEITKNRKGAHDAQFWNTLVFVFGVAGMIITTNPMSPLCLWLSMGSYSIQLKFFGSMFDNAKKHGSTLLPTGIFLIHTFCLIGNHGATLVYGLNRFEVLTFPQFVFVDGISQWIAKFVFGMVVIFSMGNGTPSEVEVKEKQE